MLQGETLGQFFHNFYEFFGNHKKLQNDGKTFKMHKGVQKRRSRASLIVFLVQTSITGGGFIDTLVAPGDVTSTSAGPRTVLAARGAPLLPRPLVRCLVEPIHGCTAVRH